METLSYNCKSFRERPICFSESTKQDWYFQNQEAERQSCLCNLCCNYIASTANLSHQLVHQMCIHRYSYKTLCNYSRCQIYDQGKGRISSLCRCIEFCTAQTRIYSREVFFFAHLLLRELLDKLYHQSFQSNDQKQGQHRL